MARRSAAEEAPVRRNHPVSGMWVRAARHDEQAYVSAWPGQRWSAARGTFCRNAGPR